VTYVNKVDNVTKLNITNRKHFHDHRNTQIHQ